MRKHRTADAAANVARFDEQLVQVQRTWRIAGRERDDAGNLPVAPVATHTSPAAMSSPATPEGGKHQCHEFGVVAPYRLRAETQIPTARPPPRPGPAGCKMPGASAVSPGPNPARAASIGPPANRRAGMTGSRSRRRAS